MRKKKEDQVSVTFRTAVSNRDMLDEIAENMERDRSYVVNEAVKEFLWRYERERHILAESHAAGERGELIDQEDVEVELERWIASTVDNTGELAAR